MILVFNLGGPLLAYSLLRSAGMSTVAALVISGVLPARGIVIGAVADRRLHVIGMVVLRRAGGKMRTPGQHRYRRWRRNMTTRPYTLVRCLAP
jgi:hypothetical protein